MKDNWEKKLTPEQYRVLRVTTKKRMIRQLQITDSPATSIQSYLGLLRYGNTNKLQESVGK